MKDLENIYTLAWYPDDEDPDHPGYLCCACGPNIFADDLPPHEGPCMFLCLDWSPIVLANEAMAIGARIAKHKD